MMVPVIAWGLALAWGSAAPSSAPLRGVDVIWNAPPGCPDKAAVTAALARRLGPAATTDAQVDGIVRAGEPDGFVVEFKVSVPHGALRRTVGGPTCLAAVDAAVGIAAVMIAPEVAALRERAVDPLEPIAPAPSRPRLPTPTGFLRVSGAGSFGLLPRWGGGAGVAAGVDIARARVEVRSLFDAPQRALLPAPDASASFSAWGTGVLGCFVPFRGVLQTPLCGGSELVWIRARPRGLAVDRIAHRVVVDVVGAVALSYQPAPWLALRAEVAGLIVLTPGRFVIDDIGVVHRIRAGGMRLALGVEFRLPSRRDKGAR